MRPYSIACVLLAMATLPAAAGTRGGRGGSGGGGGRLGAVSAGIDRATPSSSSSSSSSSSRPSRRDHRDSSSSSSSDSDWSSSSSSSYDDDDGYTCYDCRTTPLAVWANGTPTLYPAYRMPRVDVSVDGFAGAQKVYESEGSFSLEFSLIFGHRVRLNAATSHYFENQMDGGRVTMNTPTATLGVRVGELGATRVWAEGGYAHVSTNDPAGSSSVHGGALALRLQRDLTSRVLLVGSAGMMLFDGFQAYTGRIGVRMNHIEAGFRVLDFTVGPALFGPEIGVAF